MNQKSGKLLWIIQIIGNTDGEYAFAGMLISTIFGLIFAAYEISPWYHLVGGIPSMFTGGAFSFFTIANSYLMDITNPENRGIR